jgi:hypothetical protein
MKDYYFTLLLVPSLALFPLKGQSPGSTYFPFNSRIRVTDVNPANPEANPSAYVITGDSITVEAWIFPMRLPGNGESSILVLRPYYNAEPWRAYELQIDNSWSESNDPRIGFTISDGHVPENSGTALDPNLPVLGSWTHVAGTYDGFYVRLYINGEVVDSAAYTANIGAGDTGFYIGGLADQYYDGLIDEVRLWNITRTKVEIQANMNQIMIGSEEGLAGYWPLEEITEPNVAVDLTGNHNDLHLQWGAYFVLLTPDSVIRIAPEFSPPLLETVVGDFFEYAPKAAGWPWPELSFVYGPSGMIFDSASGTVQWTPLAGQDGFHDFMLRAENDVGYAEASYTLWIDKYPILSREHNNNNTVLSVFNNGILARDAAGFQYYGMNGLFEGSLLVAQSDQQVSGGLFVREFSTESSVQPTPSLLPGFDQAFLTEYSDQRAPNPIGVHVVQMSHSKSTSPDENYVLISYGISNTSGADLTGIHVGLGLDWDVGDYSINLCGYEAERRLSYMYEEGGPSNPHYYGISALSDAVSGHTIWTGSSGVGSDSIQYTRMTSFSEVPTVPADYRTVLALGPYDIPAHDYIEVTFALVGGMDLAELRSNTDVALGIEFEPAPAILSVVDVPHDQGGKVTIRWHASSLDHDVDILPYYSIWRAIPDPGLLGKSMNDRERLLRMVTIMGQTYAWEWIGMQPAHHFPIYSYTAPTLYDSMSTTDGNHYYLVSAHTADPDIFFDSLPDSGYSVDNLAPQPPHSLAGSWDGSRVVLKWARNNEPDLREYLIYRSSYSDIEPETTPALAATMDTLFLDHDPPPGDHLYYVVAAADLHDNLSQKNQEVMISLLNTREGGDIPRWFMLSQNYPNPFNPETIVNYQLPQGGSVKLFVYSTLGEVVRVLVEQSQPAGYYSVTWDGRDDWGRTLAAGIYIAHLSSSNYSKSIKMVLLK